MFAIGCLEAEEAVAVSSHIASDCETCWLETRRSAQFWALFGSGLPEQSAADLPEIGNWMRPFRRPKRAPAHLSWYRWGAVAAVLALATASAVFLYDRGTSNRTTPAAQNTAEIQALRGRVADLKTQRDELARAAKLAQAPTSSGNANSEDTALRRALAQRQKDLAQREAELTHLRQALDVATAALQRNRAALTGLEGRLENDRQVLQVAVQQQNEARAQAASASAAQHGAEQRVRDLSAQVGQLSRERAQLLQDVQQRQSQISQNLQLTNLLSTPGTRLIPVVGSEAAPQSHGYALLTPDHRLLFFASSLPALPNGREYQLWLLRSRSPGVVSAGVFQASSNGTGEIEFSNPALANSISSIAVTDEPAGGSKLPTGHKILIGVARS